MAPIPATKPRDSNRVAIAIVVAPMTSLGGRSRPKAFQANCPQHFRVEMKRTDARRPGPLTMAIYAAFRMLIAQVADAARKRAGGRLVGVEELHRRGQADAHPRADVSLGAPTGVRQLSVTGAA